VGPGGEVVGAELIAKDQKVIDAAAFQLGGSLTAEVGRLGDLVHHGMDGAATDFEDQRGIGLVRGHLHDDGIQALRLGEVDLDGLAGMKRVAAHPETGGAAVNYGVKSPWVGLAGWLPVVSGKLAGAIEGSDLVDRP
jgi:hypothetical protein